MTALIIYFVLGIPACVMFFWYMIFGVRPFLHELKSFDMTFTFDVFGFGKISKKTQSGLHITLIAPFMFFDFEFTVFDTIK